MIVAPLSISLPASPQEGPRTISRINSEKVDKGLRILFTADSLTTWQPRRRRHLKLVLQLIYDNCPTDSFFTLNLFLRGRLLVASFFSGNKRSNCRSINSNYGQGDLIVNWRLHWTLPSPAIYFVSVLIAAPLGTPNEPSNGTQWLG